MATARRASRRLRQQRASQVNRQRWASKCIPRLIAWGADCLRCPQSPAQAAYGAVLHKQAVSQARFPAIWVLLDVPKRTATTGLDPPKSSRPAAAVARAAARGCRFATTSREGSYSLRERAHHLGTYWEGGTNVCMAVWKKSTLWCVCLGSALKCDSPNRSGKSSLFFSQSPCCNCHSTLFCSQP